MRLPVEARLAYAFRIAVALVAGLTLAACGGGAGNVETVSASNAHSQGPRGDYPVIVGDPYTITETTYTPEDVLNYDEVGFLAADPAGGSSITGSHHTLPLPSYVEVTSLETGRTILVRLERRGPMDGHQLIALSPGAHSQLAAEAGTPVRVRRVNPPEDQRTLLRAGREAAPRMDTPMSLVEILKRKLPIDAASVARATPPEATVQLPAPGTGSLDAAQTAGVDGATGLPPMSPSAPGIVPAAAPAQSAAQRAKPRGAFVVQAASFSTADRAQRAARVLDGEVTRAGQSFRGRTGPSATRGEAVAALAKVRAAGYSDARILTNG